MNALLTALSLILRVSIILLAPEQGLHAVLLCVILASFAGYVIHRVGNDKRFLLQIFVAGLLIRMVIATVIFIGGMQNFFGGDAFTYDGLGYAMLKVWQGNLAYRADIEAAVSGWGMLYLVGGIYAFTGRNMLAVQLVMAVIGAATAPAVFLCAQSVFHNIRVARIAAFLVAFFPSLVLWSSQGLKDAPIVFLLATSMLATLRLGEKFSYKYTVVLICSLVGILSLRFYIFYMLVVAIGGAFVIGTQQITARRLWNQLGVMVLAGLAMTYLGVLRSASAKFDTYMNLEAVQRSRTYLAQAQSGFGSDVDVSTTSGAIQTIPVGVTYLMFAPFPWHYSITSIRQNLTLPEMIVWWCSFPLLVLGLWFTIRYRWRQCLPILIFTLLLTLAYSLFQGNVGTAYRQRAQLLIFYFIFVAVGIVLLWEKNEDEQRQAITARRALLARRFSRSV